MVRIASWIVLAAIAVTAATAAAEKKVIDRIVAVVEDEAIFQSDVETMVRQYMLQQGESNMSAEDREALEVKILQDLINDRLVIAQAGRLDVDVEFAEVEERVNDALAENRRALGGEEAFARQLEREGFTIDELKKLYRRQIRNQMLIERVLQMEMAKKGRAEVDEEKLRAFYEENKHRLPRRPAVVHLQTIFFGFETSTSATGNAREKIDAVHQRALAGESFEELAREVSEDPSGKNGGDLGFVNPDDLRDPAFAAAVRELEIGEISDPVLTGYGYHIIQVTERRPDQGEVRVRHILVRIDPSEGDIEEVFQTANEVYNEIKNGADFGEMADRYSTDPAAGAGGDLGWLKVADLPEFFQDVLENLAPGDVSQVLRESSGFRIVKLLEREEAREYQFSEVEKDLRRLYAQEQMNVAYADYVAELREQFTVDLKY